MIKRLLICLLALLLIMPGMPGKAETQLRFQEISIYAKKNIPVFAAPSTKALRGAKGKAAVSTDGAIWAAGWDGDWLLILYEVGGGQYRAGYIQKDKFSGDPLPGQHLAFSGDTITLTQSCELTDDPNTRIRSLATLKAGKDVTLLAALNDMLYVETKISKKTARGFIPRLATSLGPVENGPGNSDEDNIPGDGEIPGAGTEWSDPLVTDIPYDTDDPQQDPVSSTPTPDSNDPPTDDTDGSDAPAADGNGSGDPDAVVPDVPEYPEQPPKQDLPHIPNPDTFAYVGPDWYGFTVHAYDDIGKLYLYGTDDRGYLMSTEDGFMLHDVKTINGVYEGPFSGHNLTAEAWELPNGDVFVQCIETNSYKKKGIFIENVYVVLRPSPKGFIPLMAAEGRTSTNSMILKAYGQQASTFFYSGGSSDRLTSAFADWGLTFTQTVASDKAYADVTLLRSGNAFIGSFVLTDHFAPGYSDLLDEGKANFKAPVDDSQNSAEALIVSLSEAGYAVQQTNRAEVKDQSGTVTQIRQDYQVADLTMSVWTGAATGTVEKIRLDAPKVKHIFPRKPEAVAGIPFSDYLPQVYRTIVSSPALGLNAEDSMSLAAYDFGWTEEVDITQEVGVKGYAAAGCASVIFHHYYWRIVDDYIAAELEIVLTPAP